MKKAMLAGLAVTLFAGVASPGLAAAPRDAELDKLARGNAAFALDLYARLAVEDGNLFFSPYSISTALAMTYAGARGDTATQKDGKVALRVANALWPHSGYPFLRDYLAQVKRFYGVNITQVSYSGTCEAARRQINGWTERMTEGMIKELIPKGILNALTRLVLTNAIYFKGDWQSQFKKAATKDAPFTMADGRTRQVPLMYQEGRFGYAEGNGIQVLELPYGDGELSMVVILPRQADGLAKLEAKLSPAQFTKWTGLAKKQKVRVYLPRFEMKSPFALGEVLAKMGMRDAFNPTKANFAGMDGTRDLFIQAVLHQAFVAVDEKGTEAAAATAVVMGLRSAARPRPAPVFRADHPFLFTIRENSTGSILFMGRLAEPEE